MTTKLNNSQMKILATLKQEDALNYEELARLTGLSYDGVRGRISELTQLGFSIERTRDGKNTVLSYDGSEDDEIEIKTKVKVESVAKPASYDQIHEMLEDIKKMKVKTTKFSYKPMPNEHTYAVLALSDLHVGEKILDPMTKKLLYNVDIAEQRMNTLTESTILELKKRKIKHIKLAMIGDMIDGDMIYRNHLFKIDKPAIEQIQDCARILAHAIKTYVKNNISVSCHCVRGNHGTTNYQNLEEDNWDSVVYDMLNLIFMENKMVEINHYPSNQAKFDVGNKQIVLYHGQKIGCQIKTASGLKEFRGMCGKHKLQDGDMILVGHYHEFGVEIDQGKFLIRNGSLADTSEYAFSLNLYSVPEQTLLIVKDDKQYSEILPMEVV